MKILTCRMAASFLVILISAGCGGIPPTFYYRIDYGVEALDKDGGEVPYTIGVRQFAADVLFEGDKIVYRKSPFEVQFYHYRRWIAPPKKLVTEKVLKQYEASNVFRNVVRLPSSQDIDYVLNGKVQAFEEWDERDLWYGIVTIEFELQNPETGEVVWEGVITEKTQAKEKKPVEVVQAISQSLSQVVRKSIDDIRTTLGVKKSEASN